jgi:type II secretory pathway component PulF
MPFFQYLATDRQGNSVQGTLQAATFDEASRALVRQGFQVTSLRDPGQMAGPPVQPAPPMEVRNRAPVQIQSLANRPEPAPVKTRYTKDADIYFLFNQLASYFKAGINPAKAFADIGAKQKRQDIREALQYISARTTEGGSIADHMERYPYLFPPHVVGTVRAGETGGYLPEAMDSIAHQADASRKLRRLMAFLGWTALGIPPIIPLGKAFFNAVLSTWKVQDASGGTAPVAPALWKGFVEQMTTPFFFLWMVAFAVFVVFAFVWQSLKVRLARHRMALSVPAIGKRAKAESYSAFTWNLANLSRAAIPPRQAFVLAADTVPNQHLRERLQEQGRRMTDQTKLSDALEATNLMPYELSMMVQTGEVTGDVAGQLFQSAQAQQEEFEHRDRDVKSRVGCWMLLLFFAVGPAVLFWLYRDYLLGLFDVLAE